MIPVIFNPYPNAASREVDALDHAWRAARNLRHLSQNLDGSQSPRASLQALTGEMCDSLQGCVLFKHESGEHITLPALLQRIKSKKEQFEAIRWLLTFFSKGNSIAASSLTPHDATTLEDAELPVPLLGYAAARGGIAATISADSSWHQDYFSLRNPHAKVLNVSSNSNQEILEGWVKEWLQHNLDFMEYLETRFKVCFYKGARHTVPPKEFHAGLQEAFEKAQDRSYACDGDLIKFLNTGSSCPSLLELRAYGDGARAFFRLQDGRPYIAGFYTKGQAISQSKAIRQAAQRMTVE